MGIKVDILQGKRREQIDGISRYSNEVMHRLREEVDFKVIGFSGQNLTRQAKARSLIQYPFMVARDKRDDSIKHCMSMVEAHLLNYLKLRPSVVTCYDIFPLLPASYPFLERSFLKFAVRGMLKADRIITISEFSKKEVVDRLGYPREKVSVVYPGVDHDRYRPMPARKELMERLNLDPDARTVLYVGMEQPRKNLAVLIKALGRLRRSGVDAKLLKIGRPHRSEDRRKLLDAIQEQGLQKDVTIIDYVPEEELPLAYNLADLFVFPSSYEGFGLPPLEAMACGCPVITSDAPVFVEVGGEASLKVDPQDEMALAHEMKRVLQDETLASELKEKGLKQALGFTWERSARETLNVYLDLADKVH